MTVGAAIALAAFHLENDDFLGTEEIFDHAGDLGTFDNGGTDIELAVISGDSENLIEDNFVAGFDTDFFDLDDITDLNFILFSAMFTTKSLRRKVNLWGTENRYRPNRAHRTATPK